MQGKLSEFTLAQLLQFFALAERSGAIDVRAKGRQSRLLVEGDKIIGWGHDGYDVREPILACALIPGDVAQAIHSLQPRKDTPGLSFVVRNLVEPQRWDLFARRQLEQDIYPLLSIEEGEFDVSVFRNPPAPLRVAIPINSLILDGSRWESEMEASAQEGFHLDGKWRRSVDYGNGALARMSGLAWMVWATLRTPMSIGALARQLGAPDLETINAIKRLRLSNLAEEAG